MVSKVLISLFEVLTVIGVVFAGRLAYVAVAVPFPEAATLTLLAILAIIAPLSLAILVHNSIVRNRQERASSSPAPTG